MKIEFAVPVWGPWVDIWLRQCWPNIKHDCEEVGASVAIYTDQAGGDKLSGLGELRALPPATATMDRADMALTDALDRALRGGHAVAPFMAGMQPGRGTLGAAARLLDVGYRGVMAALVPTRGLQPETWAPAARLARHMAEHGGVLYWKNRMDCAHPGHYGWRCGNAVLLRSIYTHPVLLAPVRQHAPQRAIDHYAAEGYLGNPDLLGFVEPDAGCFAGILGPQGSAAAAGGGAPRTEAPHFREVPGVVGWFKANARPFNVWCFQHRFWLGAPPARDRLAVEMTSDKVVAEISAGFFS